MWGFFLKVGSSGQCISRFANETIKLKEVEGGRERGKGRNCASTRALVVAVVALAVNG